ncbi:MAG: hypothetical protein R8K50_08430, partial [Mariprofundus sp.]
MTNILATVYAQLPALIVIFITVLFLTALILFIIDITQTSNAVRRNYPLIGRFRALFEHLGT